MENWKQMNWNEANAKIEFCEKEAEKVFELIKELLPKDFIEYKPLAVLNYAEEIIGVTYDFANDNQLEPPTNEEKEEIINNIGIVNNWIVKMYDWVYDTIEELKYRNRKANNKEATKLIIYYMLVDSLYFKIHRLKYYD